MKLAKILVLSLIIALFSSVVQAQTELEYWFNGTTAQVEFMQAAVDEYNAMQSDVVVTLVQTPDSQARIATALAGGQGPDIMWYNHNMPWFFGVEVVYPLNDLITDPEIGIDPDAVFPAARGTVHYGGIVQAIPINHGPGGLLVNLDIFEANGLSVDDIPETWEEVEALAIQLTERDDAGNVTQWGLVNGVVDWNLQEIALSNATDWSVDDLSRYVENPDNLVEGLEWWRKLLVDEGVMPFPSGVTWAGVEATQTSGEAFIRGEAAMSGFHGLTSAGGFLDQNPDLNIAGVLTPLGPSSGGNRIVSLGFGGLFVMTDAVDPVAGYMFNKWFFENKTVDYAKLTPGSVPSSVAALDDEFFQNDPILGFGRVLNAMTEAELRTHHVFPGRLDVRSQEPTMAESVLLERATPQEAVDTFLAHATQVFELYRMDLDEFLEADALIWD